MPLFSSAQNQEDIILWRALGDVENGFYIDAGAADPVELSVTRVFYEQGWHGLNLEPNPTYFAALCQARLRDINLPLGVSRTAGTSTFYNVENGALSTFDAAIAAAHRAKGHKVTEQHAETLPLAEICRRHRPQGPIHFLKIDVEGSEHDVLSSADFTTFRPWIVLIEATLPETQTECHAQWEPLLTGQGYHFVWFDGLNRFYVAGEHLSRLAGHFKLPPNIFDGFAPASYLLHRLEQAEQNLRLSQATHVDGLSYAAALARAKTAEAALRAIQTSTSWRLTAPLRALTHRFKHKTPGAEHLPR
jgi:FkbM family methyltransferase